MQEEGEKEEEGEEGEEQGERVEEGESGGGSSGPDLKGVPGLVGPEEPSVPLRVVTDSDLFLTRTYLHTVTYLTEMAGTGDMTRLEVMSSVVTHHPAFHSLAPRVTAQVTPPGTQSFLPFLPCFPDRCVIPCLIFFSQLKRREK